MELLKLRNIQGLERICKRSDPKSSLRFYSNPFTNNKKGLISELDSSTNHALLGDQKLISLHQILMNFWPLYIVFFCGHKSYRPFISQQANLVWEIIFPHSTNYLLRRDWTQQNSFTIVFLLFYFSIKTLKREPVQNGSIILLTKG